VKNLNLLFNKTYYETIGQDDFDDVCKKNNKEIVSVKFCANDYRGIDPFMKDIVKAFSLKTSYPGLIVGSGYSHGTDKNNDIKIGFSFDYVSGQPYLPGSSVKGVLRSCFKNQPEAMGEILKNVIKEKNISVKDLEQEIFESGDVFLDAVIKKGSPNFNRYGGNLLDLDNITPHEGLTRTPKPLLLLRIMPEVTIEFRFVIKNSEILNADEKLELFKTILEIFGIGSKTNVGYGNLSSCD